MTYLFNKYATKCHHFIVKLIKAGLLDTLPSFIQFPLPRIILKAPNLQVEDEGNFKSEDKENPLSFRRIYGVYLKAVSPISSIFL
jgi:hypothetical protein